MFSFVTQMWEKLNRYVRDLKRQYRKQKWNDMHVTFQRIYGELNRLQGILQRSPSWNFKPHRTNFHGMNSLYVAVLLATQHAKRKPGYGNDVTRKSALKEFKRYLNTTTEDPNLRSWLAKDTVSQSELSSILTHMESIYQIKIKEVFQGMPDTKEQKTNSIFIKRQDQSFQWLEPMPRHDISFSRLKTHSILGDGNCLFRAIALAVHNDQDQHGSVRAAVVKKLDAEWGEKEVTSQETEELKAYTTNYPSGGLTLQNQYLHFMRQSGVWGGERETQAAAKAYDRPIVVHTPTNTLEYNSSSKGSPIQLKVVNFHQNKGHYELVK